MGREGNGRKGRGTQRGGEGGEEKGWEGGTPIFYCTPPPVPVSRNMPVPESSLQSVQRSPRI